MEEDSDQCQSDCDCRRCALVPSAYLAALAYCEYAQQRRCYDRAYGDAAGRYGDCGSTVKESVLLLLRVFHASDWIADGKAILMTVYLSAITPSCATVTSMAQLYNRDAAHSSALYVLSTLLSIMTMPLMIGLFDMLV